MEPIVYPETSLPNYESTLRNISEDLICNTAEVWNHETNNVVFPQIAVILAPNAMVTGNELQDLRLPPRCKGELRFSGILVGVEW